MWVATHCRVAILALGHELQLRGFETELRGVESTETIERWGPVRQLSSGDTQGLKGLSAAQIAGLKSHVFSNANEMVGVTTDIECSICVDTFAIGDAARR